MGVASVALGACAPIAPYRGAAPAPGSITAFSPRGTSALPGGWSLRGTDPLRHFLGELVPPPGAESLVVIVYGDNRPGYHMEARSVEWGAIRAITWRNPKGIARGLLFLPLFLVEAVVPALDGPRDLIAAFGKRPGGGGERRVLAGIERLGRADLVISTGDAVFDGRRGRLWEDYVRRLGPLRERVAYLAAPGNHERTYDAEAAASWSAAVMTPAEPGKLWYAVDVPAANARLVFLDSNALADPRENYPAPLETALAEEQLAWLDSVLAAPAGRRFVIFHHPLISAGHYTRDWGGDAPDDPVGRRRARLFELFGRYRVTAVFSGHEHLYQRVEVKREGGGGTWLVTTAGGGSPRYTVDRRAAAGELARPLPPGLTVDRASAFMRREYHVCRVVLPLDPAASSAVRMDAYKIGWTGAPEPMDRLEMASPQEAR
jgi:hypothetical protein